MVHALSNWLASGFILVIFSIPLSVIADSLSNETATVDKSETKTYTDMIKRDILANYDKFSRPAEYNQTTKLEIGLAITHIDLDEKKSTLTVYGWTRMFWKDEKIKWNSSDYGDLSVVHLPGHEIWQPDIGAYNSAADAHLDSYGNTLLLAYSNGQVLWVPPSQFSIFCELDFSLWPFDTQTCSLILGSWTYTDRDVLVEIKDGDNQTEHYIENNEWSIKEVVASVVDKNCCLNPYQSAKFDITIQRRSPMYKTIVITPASCVILLILACFWLPPQAGEKIVLNSINVIFILTFMLYFAQLLPVLAASTPLVVLFYSSSLVLSSVSTVVSVLVLYFSSTKHHYRVPHLITNLLGGPIGTVLCLDHANPRVAEPRFDGEMHEDSFEAHNEEHQTIEQSPKISIQHDWVILATAIDRIFFLIYCIVFIVLAAIYSV